MKKILLLVVLMCSINYSCLPDDSDSGADPDGPVISNIRFEVTTTRNTAAIITTTINNDTQTDEVENLPFSLTYAQVEIESGTYFQLTFLENGVYNVTPEGSSWTDYTAVLNIYIDEVLVRTDIFNVNEDNASTIREIDLTVN
ncbi:hypothetical protein [Psychroserpens luteolus]|uniref:hypothetical protein n=1 Tax=Psychroserpens luteolus TaxID=2855840 RepID=UPI001E3D39F1|nr:hypothetical protein [Psychroserpens luteolus]MCD2260485.1 hypothetical protein [Psychroserpens luteolus]